MLLIYIIFYKNNIYEYTLIEKLYIYIFKHNANK